MAPRKKNQPTAEQPAQDMEQSVQEQEQPAQDQEQDHGQSEQPVQEQEQDHGQSEQPVQEQEQDHGQSEQPVQGGDREDKPGKEQQRDEFANIPNPCVYCGPTVRGVARQYTTYQGGIPNELKSFIKEHPAARRLIVPTEQFANVRKRLETPGTAEAIMYKKVKSELQ